MNDVADWEERFVRSFIVKAKRNRYLTFLRSPKSRRKIIGRLHHNLDYLQAKAADFGHSALPATELARLLRAKGAAASAYLITCDEAYDGCELELETAAAVLLGEDSGVVMICPPRPIAIYKPEDPTDLILLQP